MFNRRSRFPKALFPIDKSAPQTSSTHFSGIFPQTSNGYAVVISKKILNRAVDRHRLKRRVLAALHHQRAQMLPKALILFPKATMLRLSSDEIRTDLAHLLSR